MPMFKRAPFYKASLFYLQIYLIQSLLVPLNAPAATHNPLFSPSSKDKLYKYFSLSDGAFEQVALDSIIDGLQNRYARMSSLAANFLQSYQGSDGRVISESGQLWLKRPGKARWDYTAPEKKLFISDGKNIFFYVYGEAHATKASIKESSDPQIPFLFLLGRGNLRKDFARIELLNDERAVESGNRVLRLVPKKAPEDFKKLLVEVNPSSYQVKRLVIFERSGARMDFVLSQVRENLPVADSQFQFTPPAGITIKKQ